MTHKRIKKKDQGVWMYIQIKQLCIYNVYLFTTAKKRKATEKSPYRKVQHINRSIILVKIDHDKAR